MRFEVLGPTPLPTPAPTTACSTYGVSGLIHYSSGNGIYTRNDAKVTGGKETYWLADDKFMFWCTPDQSVEIFSLKTSIRICNETLTENLKILAGA